MSTRERGGCIIQGEWGWVCMSTREREGGVLYKVSGAGCA